MTRILCTHPPKEKLYLRLRQRLSYIARSQFDSTLKVIFYRVVKFDLETGLSKWQYPRRYKKSYDQQITFTENLIRLFSGKPITRDELRISRSVTSFIEKDSVCQNILTHLQKYLLELRHKRKAACRRVNPAIAPNILDKDTSSLGQESESLDRFPLHISQITELVRSARKSIYIQTDTIDYGSFRDFDRHLELIQAIIERPKNCRLAIVPMDKPQAMSWANKFREPLVRKIAKSEFLVCLEEFLNRLEEYKHHFPVEHDLVRTHFANNADWVAENGAIVDLGKLQSAYQNLVWSRLDLEIAGPEDVRGTNSSVQPNYKASEKYPKLIWIADEREAIVIETVPDEDAFADRVIKLSKVARLVKTFERLL